VIISGFEGLIEVAQLLMAKKKTEEEKKRK
jgi:hypothetical protein